MLGILIIVLVSIGLAYLVKRDPLAFLGLNEPARRLGEFAWGLAVAALIAGTAHALSVFLQGGSWSVADTALRWRGSFCSAPSVTAPWPCRTPRRTTRRSVSP